MLKEQLLIPFQAEYIEWRCAGFVLSLMLIDEFLNIWIYFQMTQVWEFFARQDEKLKYSW